ncbi:MAG: FAD-binding oxidoreductase [Actinobacteria bacterium]|nr:FAD-binding oxidoreductase [Actinomycetota bacterium]MBI3688613.1 FAD-binding oxidoreductase [Actinomycetota bacterium]
MDSVVIGGGIAGLLTALRLARSGHEVALVEADRLGAGATCANHGMLHSGALYVRQHGHIVRHCRQAQSAFGTLLAAAELPTDPAVYVVPDADTPAFLTGLDTHRIPYQRTAADTVDELPADIAAAHVLVTVNERVFSSRRLVEILAGQCLAAGVTILTGSTVERITRASGRVTGIRLGATEHLSATSVVVAAGIGTPALLAQVGSRHVPLLKSRLDMMLHFPRSRVRRGLIFAQLDRAVVMPAPGGGALASFFGGVQPPIAGRRGFAVDLDKAALLGVELARALAPGLVGPTGGVAYMAGKTDYVGSPHAENGVINPGFHVIDHGAGDDLVGLYTVVTGKMTLAFHASKAAADAVGGGTPTCTSRTSTPTRFPPGCSPWNRGPTRESCDGRHPEPTNHHHRRDPGLRQPLVDGGGAHRPERRRHPGRLQRAALW